MHFRCVFTLLKWLCAGRIRLGWAHDILLLHITCSCIFMHTFLTFSIFLYIDCVWCFSTCLSLFLSLSLLLSVSCSMAPKWKSTPSRNPLCSRASSSSDPTLYCLVGEKIIKEKFLWFVFCLYDIIMLTLSNRWFRDFESITEFLDCLHCGQIFICWSNITLKIPQSCLVLFYYRWNFFLRRRQWFKVFDSMCCDCVY